MNLLRNSKCEDSFPFLQLPGELRNKIYKYALGSFTIVIESLEHELYDTASPRTPYLVEVPEPGCHGIHSTTWSVRPKDPEILPMHVPLNLANWQSLLFVSCQIRQEAAPFYYQKPHHFASAAAIVPYLQDQPLSALQLIETVELHVDCFSTMDMELWDKACRWMSKKLQLKSLFIGHRAIPLNYLPDPGPTNPEDKWPQVEKDLARLPWIQALCSITGLDSLSLARTTFPNYDAALLRYLKPRMVKSSKSE
ncbi:MAG: hypothetical protein M1836_000512 [Candelina mexicana]|nr:MAG: hypothetical protein M1836_000512 [Candelina mexicana]